MKSASVSYNQNVNNANEQVENLEKQGYLVIESYWDDWDCGQILMKGETNEEKRNVKIRHQEHLLLCKEQQDKRNSILGAI